MWIKKDNEDAVQLSFVQNITKFINTEENVFCIRFYQTDKQFVRYSFKSAKEVNNYYEALMKKILAEEVIPKNEKTFSENDINTSNLESEINFIKNRIKFLKEFFNNGINL